MKTNLTLDPEIELFLDKVSTYLGAQIGTFDFRATSYFRYVLSTKGKNLRPLLVALSASAVGGQLSPKLIVVAAICEMVHLAMLTHDDVIDGAPRRRGLPTVSTKWGHGIALLIGDALFARAFELAAEFYFIDVCREVAAATKVICSGELLQANNHLNFDLSFSTYSQVCLMKTAEMFVLSCSLGANPNLVGSTIVERSILRNFGRELGRAYQMHNDLLGWETDLVNGSMTLPFFILRDEASKADWDKFRNSIWDKNPAVADEVRRMFDRYAVMEEARDMIQHQVCAAQKTLVLLPDSEAKQRLLTLANQLLK
jgi:octaprenyl-diphosphate synthase